MDDVVAAMAVEKVAVGLMVWRTGDGEGERMAVAVTAAATAWISVAGAMEAAMEAAVVVLWPGNGIGGDGGGNGSGGDRGGGDGEGGDG